MPKIPLERGHSSWILRQEVSGAITLAVVIVGLLAPSQSLQAQTFRVLHQFAGGSDGMSPTAGLVRDAAGNLYGTTYYGGGPGCPFLGEDIGCGIVFKLDPNRNETILYRFTGGPDGGNPEAGLVRDRDGNLYGTTYYGGDLNCSAPYGCGTVFKVDVSGAETVLHSFNAADGPHPYADLLRDAAGNLYGTTLGGEGSFGTVFKLNTSGKLRVLYRFTNGADGGGPAAGLIRDAAGNLYSTTVEGGVSNFGTVFKLDSTGTETVLHSFAGSLDGAYPLAGLVRDAAGNLYGTTESYGPFRAGTVFKLDSTGAETVLHSFAAPPDGAYPYAGLVRDTAGNLYGTTNGGGSFGAGTVFKLDPAGKLTVLHSFSGNADGANPDSALVRDASGNLYGATYLGGDLTCINPNGHGVRGCGTVFKVTF